MVTPAAFESMLTADTTRNPVPGLFDASTPKGLLRMVSARRSRDSEQVPGFRAEPANLHLSPPSVCLCLPDEGQCTHHQIIAPVGLTVLRMPWPEKLTVQERCGFAVRGVVVVSISTPPSPRPSLLSRRVWPYSLGGSDGREGWCGMIQSVLGVMRGYAEYDGMHAGSETVCHIGFRVAAVAW